jgi:hypothetical protein
MNGKRNVAGLLRSGFTELPGYLGARSMRPGYPAGSCRSSSPGLTGLEGSHDWVSCAMEVFGCVFMGGLAATADVAALQAQAEVNPVAPDL